MPKTRTQSLVFTMMMVFCMVYCMTVYIISLSSKGLTGQIFGAAIKEMWIEYLIVFCLEYFVITKQAVKFAGKILDPERTRPIFFILAVQIFTVCITVPTITLIVTILHNGFSSNCFVKWITQIVICFPMAFFIQLFFIGPLVRNVFRFLVFMVNRLKRHGCLG